MLIKRLKIVCLAFCIFPSAAGCARGASLEFQLRLVETERAAPETDLFSPHFTRCTDCVAYNLKSQKGSRLIRAEAQPRTTFTSSDVRELRVAEVRHPARPGVVRWVVWAVPTDDAWRRKFLPIYEQFLFDEVLVTRDRQVLGIDNIATWDNGIELGRYRDRDQAAAVVAQFGDHGPEVTWIPYDEKAYEQLRKELRHALGNPQE